MIKVYPSILPCEPCEAHQADGVSLCQWMRDNVDNYRPGPRQPVSISVNGSLVAPTDWADRVVRINDDVAIRVQPGAAVPAAVWWAIGVSTVVSVGVGLAFQPGTPNQPGSGSSLSPANARANIARLGQVVPEVFGSYRRYPDYLTPPHRHFQSKRRQWLQMLLCVGPGEYEIPISGVKVGDTPLTALGGNAEYAVYGPGEDISGETAAQWWHNVEEVGSTSTGASGLDLGTIQNISNYPDASSFTFSGNTISIPAGAGEFPAGWNNTLTVRVEQYLDYEIQTGGTRDIIRGPLDQLGAFVGMKIEIEGDNAGLYEVHSFTASVPDDPGSASTLTGDAAPSRYDFDVTPVSFDVILDGNTQSITFNTDLTDLSGLLSELNSQLDATIQAQDDGSGKVELVEQGPNYSGETITLSGTTSDVFGGSPVGVTGDETTVAAEAEMTLSYDSGDPVTGFTPNAGRMAIGYEGMLYLVDGATTNEIELSRLDDAGDPDLSWPGFDTKTTTDAVIYVTGSSAEAGWSGPFNVCPEGEQTDTLEVDVFFPKGMAYISSSGNVRRTPQRVQLQYRESGTSDEWTSVDFSYLEATLDQIGFTHTIDLGGLMSPEVRMRRTGPPSTEKAQRDVQWYGLRGLFSAPNSYPWTTIAVRLKDAGQLGAQSENQINVMAERILPVFDGNDWQTESPTRDIAPAVRQIAHSIGYTDEQIDMDELERLDAVWKGRGDHFDFVFNETTVRDALKTVLRTGMSELTLDQGRILPVRDEPRTTLENSQAFSPQNMTSPLTRSFSPVRPEEPDGVDVEFTSRETWSKQTVECRLPGDLGIRTRKITLDGVTEQNQAWQAGMRLRQIMKYRRWEYSFDTELDGLNANYMSYVPILDDLPSYGQSSIMQAIEDDGEGNALLTVSEPMDWSDTEASYVVAYRNPDGTVAGPWPATRGADDYQIIAAMPLPWPDLSARQEPPHVYFGTTERWAFKALITSVRPRGQLGASVTAVNYDDRVYDYDDQTPPA